MYIIDKFGMFVANVVNMLIDTIVQFYASITMMKMSNLKVNISYHVVMGSSMFTMIGFRPNIAYDMNTILKFARIQRRSIV
jgi:hypothetical protein